MTHWSLARALRAAALLSIIVALTAPVMSAVPQAEADKLKTTLTPFGAERAGSADGQIPAWTGQLTPNSTFRSSPFDNEKPILTISAANMAQYADRLSEGIKEMMRRYPDYKIVVYPTHRTEMAPQWVYDYTYQNALKGKMPDGYKPADVYGGIPFPIPQTAQEIMWNHLLHWRSPTVAYRLAGYETTADGRHILTGDTVGEEQLPYFFRGEESKFNGTYYEINSPTVGPPIRAGEQFVAQQHFDTSKDSSWILLVGQRRTRQVPNACCDYQVPSTAGLMNLDEIEGWTGELDRYNWKILGKREMYIPYNDNNMNELGSKLQEPHFLNPDRVRYELHRVWVVDATLRPGARDVVPHVRLYLDEDSWIVVLNERWDAQGKLWKVGWTFPFFDSSVPGVVFGTFAQNDLNAGTYYMEEMNLPESYYRAAKRLPPDEFAPEAMLRAAR